MTTPTASGAEAGCPENRVKALDVLTWPRVGVPSPESPDRRRENRPRYDGKAVGTVLARYYDPATAQFLTVDPKVAATLSPYGYVNGDPLNRDDPTGECPNAYVCPYPHDFSRGAARQQQYGAEYPSGNLQDAIDDYGGGMVYSDISEGRGTKVIFSDPFGQTEVVYDPGGNYYRVMNTSTNEYLSSSGAWVPNSGSANQQSSHFNNTGSSYTCIYEAEAEQTEAIDAYYAPLDAWIEEELAGEAFDGVMGDDG